MDKQVLLATGDTALDRRLEQELGCTAIPVYYREALRQLPAGFRPDVAVVSTRLPGREPLVDCVMALRLAGVRVVLIGPRPEAEELEQLVALGVHDLLVGDQPLSRIVAACHQPATLAEALAVLEQAGAAPKPGRWRQLMQGLRARMAAALPTAVRRLEVAAPPRVDRPVARNPVAVDGETTNDGTAGSDGDNSSDRAPDAEPVPATLPVRHVAGQQHEVGQQEEEAPAARLPPAGVVDKPGVHVEEEAARARGSGGRAAAAWPLQLPPGGRHVVAMVEADRAGGERLLARWAQGLASAGLRTAVLCLEPQNRVAELVGCPAPSDPWQWQYNRGALFQPVGERLEVVPAPTAEGRVEPAWVDAVLREAMEQHEMVLVDLGCRWAPRVFRPVLTLATVQVLVCSGTGYGYAAAERRLEQADLSGWTDPLRFQLVVVQGQDEKPAPVPVHLRELFRGFVTI